MPVTRLKTEINQLISDHRQRYTSIRKAEKKGTTETRIANYLEEQYKQLLQKIETIKRAIGSLTKLAKPLNLRCFRCNKVMMGRKFFLSGFFVVFFMKNKTNELSMRDSNIERKR